MFKNEISAVEMKTNFKKYEITCHFQIWHDRSTIANHGHVVFPVNIPYDEAVSNTNAEYETFSEIAMDVQSFTETTGLYLLGRCLTKDEQVSYVETHTKFRIELNVRLHTGDIPIAGAMRFFHGDGPAMQQGA